MLNKKNSSPEIEVHVKAEPLDYIVKRRVTPGTDGRKSEVVMEPETKESPGWKFDVTGAIRPTRKGLYCEVFQGAKQAIKIDPVNNNFKPNQLTADEAQGLLNMRIFKAHYGQLLKDLLDAIKPILIILAVLVVIAIALSAYNAYAASKVPEQIVNALKPTPTPPQVVG